MISTGSLPCRNPACSGRAEPEQDGDHTYVECVECGYAFDFQRVSAVLNPGNTCSVGIPEDVRRAASQPMTHALAASAPPLLTIGRPHANTDPAA